MPKRRKKRHFESQPSFVQQPTQLAKVHSMPTAYTGCRFSSKEDFRGVNGVDPGLFTMRGRRPGGSLFHWDIVSGLRFQQVIHDMKLTNSQNLPPRPKDRFKE
jgi:hypothetical protein